MEIIVQDNLLKNNFIINALREHNYTISALPDSEWSAVFKEKGREINGFIIDDLNDNILNIVRLVRNGRHSHPWLPVAYVGEISDSLFLPIGCAAFKPDEIEDIAKFLSAPINLRLLLIEDDEDIILLAKKTIGKFYTIDASTDGQDGLELYKRNHYDLVLLDFMLPTLSGDQILSEIRQIKPDQPVIVITAYDSPDREADLTTGGANEYLTKPFSPSSILKKTIIRVLNDHSMKNSLNKNEIAAQERAWEKWSSNMAEYVGDT